METGKIKHLKIAVLQDTNLQQTIGSVYKVTSFMHPSVLCVSIFDASGPGEEGLDKILQNCQKHRKMAQRNNEFIEKSMSIV